MNPRKPIIFLLFLFLFSSFVLGVPPFEPQISTGENTIEIDIPEVEFIKKDQTNVTLHTHIFNKSSGLPLIPGNTEIGCYLHLYNFLGQHTLENEMIPDNNGVEWKLDISSKNFSILGDHSYLIWCNDTHIGGFVRGGFEVTKSGVEEEEGVYENQWFLFFVVFIGIILIIIGFNVDDFALVSVGGMALGLLGGYILVNGFSTFSNEVSIGIGIILSVVGAYFFLRPIIEKVMSDLNELR